MTDTSDPSKSSHRVLAHRIKNGNGIPELRPMKLACQATKMWASRNQPRRRRPDETPSANEPEWQARYPYLGDE
ncbi:hypothetical protein PISMIDRAFT_291113 [Pisolithus microcarpus 441]|uniref:Unplaced genomic scaffold scaffold_195, whole genome shotgun sequence n=1 Tax=Pisolithus microcarpus 441 TaxID=765257 RepID=A0A0C9YPJ3_9AGAM|nr:hypothetical protein PISMIDRAFT_291113 [Pisolithus microcarpus 441]